MLGFSSDSVGKESASNSETTSNAGDPSLIPGSGRFPGEGNGYPLQYSCLGNPMDRGDCWAAVYGVIRVGPGKVTKPTITTF